MLVPLSFRPSLYIYLFHDLKMTFSHQSLRTSSPSFLGIFASPVTSTSIYSSFCSVCLSLSDISLPFCLSIIFPCRFIFWFFLVASMSVNIFLFVWSISTYTFLLSHVHLRKAFFYYIISVSFFFCPISLSFIYCPISLSFIYCPLSLSYVICPITLLLFLRCLSFDISFHFTPSVLFPSSYVTAFSIESPLPLRIVPRYIPTYWRAHISSLWTLQ